MDYICTYTPSLVKLLLQVKQIEIVFQCDKVTPNGTVQFGVEKCSSAFYSDIAAHISRDLDFLINFRNIKFLVGFNSNLHKSYWVKKKDIFQTLANHSHG